MFKNHPKGLLSASLANMGERFGFYTMIAILALFLQSKFGLTGTAAATIYSIFYAMLLGLSLVGGLIADKTRNYKNTILIGIFVMAAGYGLLSIPSMSTGTGGLIFACFALLTIAFGNGLFKGNLQAVVGQMYDNEKYGKYRDAGFSMFYMFINLGAFFSPWVAMGVRNWWLKANGFLYNANLPALCHQQLNGTITAQGTENLNRLATEVSQGAPVADLSAFSTQYLDVFTTGFHYAFLIVIISMFVSAAIYLMNRKGYPDPKDKVAKEAQTAVAEMPVAEVRQRIWALMAVFSVVIFFWFSFNQSGLSLTYFARDYVDLTIFGVPVSVETLQAFNPLFVIILTPVILTFFGWLRSKGKEPSAPKKIAIGMAIAASAFAFLAIMSNISGLPAFKELMSDHGGVSPAKVSIFVLIGTYFIVTIAELFISPLGISFVSKVAPPKLQGMMQGGWLAASGIGNFLLFIGVIFYENLSQTATWLLFTSVCLISMFTMIFMLKWLERVSKK
ncbi:MAG: peptide MFS transporter [Rikenellaceae bacterium]|nr:peptide MFS transporter [Rikenellaceae bacterium]MCL2692456.1 peptide MFS transporter [Rikenellaceae bacterium]